MRTTKVGLLTCRNIRFLTYVLEELQSLSHIEPILLFDQTQLTERQLQIIEDRVNGAFPPRALDPWLHRLPSYDVPNHNGPECISFLKANGIDLLLNAGTPRIVKQVLLDSVATGVLNCHPGILPKYRGCSCTEWAIHNDDPVGITAHFMDAGIDTGPILFSRELPVKVGQSYSDIRTALYALQSRVCAEAIAFVTERNLTSRMLQPQEPGPSFKPMPDELLVDVKTKVARGIYKQAR
jgi:methionyl-tRNA formyltransferase